MKNQLWEIKDGTVKQLACCICNQDRGSVLRVKYLLWYIDGPETKQCFNPVLKFFFVKNVTLEIGS